MVYVSQGKKRELLFLVASESNLFKRFMELEYKKAIIKLKHVHLTNIGRQYELHFN